MTPAESPMYPFTAKHQELDQRWEFAQQLERSGHAALAREQYAAILALDPRHVPALLRLSRHAQHEDDYRTSHGFAMRAADAVRYADRYRQIGHVSLRLMEFAEDAEIASMILGADWGNPHVLNQSPMLAQHLWLVGRHQDALRFIDGIAPRVPPNARLMHVRANVLRQLGLLEEAEQCYEESLSLQPEFADAHWALSTNTRSRPPLARVGRIQEALRALAVDDEEGRAHLLYALFHELDAAGELQQAWHALREGAAIMSRRARHDPAVERDLADALMRSEVVLADWNIPADLPTPVFIVGMPRTGTTLLDRMLGNSIGVESVGERSDFAISMSEALNRFVDGGLGANAIPELSADNARKAGLRYLQRVRQLAPRAAHVIDKQPRNLFDIPRILRTLPHARILCLSRNGRDACFSGLKELFHGGSYAYSYDLRQLAGHWRLTRQWMRHWSSRYPDRVQVVEYEALAADPGGELMRVQEFVGLPRDASLADITANESPITTASSAQLRQPVHGRGVGAWRRYAQYLSPLLDEIGLPE